jgi:hypothetical protein
MTKFVNHGRPMTREEMSWANPYSFSRRLYRLFERWGWVR